MITSGKSKQFLIAAAKLLIVAAAFYFIYYRLTNDDGFSFEMFWKVVSGKFTFIPIVALILLSFANRFLEILKWQNLVSVFRKISIAEASKQVLGALTVSIFTPGGVGEYGAKALFYDGTKTRKIVFLNLISNGVQMILSIFFGLFGLLYFNSAFNIITPETVGILFILFLAGLAFSFALRKITIKGYSIVTLLIKINAIPKKIHLKNNLFAVCRYLVFSHQFYLLFRIFEVDIPYFLMMATIAGVYFLASSVPTFQFLDFAVKGSVAVFFFSILGVDEWIPVFVTTMMWILNVVLPVIIGSYYVISYKPQWKNS